MTFEQLRRAISDHRQQIRGLVIALVFSVGGFAALQQSHAATYAANVEAESGVLSGNSAPGDTTNASGKATVRFGAASTPPPGQTARSISQYGITWTFDKSYPAGQFANGDWWVVGPVVVTSLTPAFTGTGNGWEANPNSGDLQGLDSRLEGFTASRVPALPYTAAVGKSIVKAISKSGTCGNDGQFHYPCITTAAVLTVLGSVPPNNGADRFRPPYFGSDKPIFTTGQLKLSILPSKAPVAGSRALAQVARRYQRVQIDYGNTWYGRYMHATDNYAFIDSPTNDDVSEYGAELGRDSAEVALRLMLNDSNSAKMPALINYVQAGIDFYGMHKGGVTWYSEGGHFLGRKLPAVIAATMLDDAAMKSEIAGAVYSSYGDDDAYYATNQKTVAAMQAAGYGPALYGRPCDPGEYEQNQTNDTGPRDCRDPIGMIDGGYEPGDSYQFCCVSQPLKGASLAARLLPGGKAV